MAAQPYEAITARVTASTTAQPLETDEADALLWLAKTVADACGDRRAAPLTCYLAGQVLAEEPDPVVRIARIRSLADELAQVLDG